MKKIFIDVETTGTNPKKHSIHQIAGLIEIDNEIVDEFDIRCQPHHKAIYDPGALKVCGKTQVELEALPPMKEAHSLLTNILFEHIDKYDRKDKAFIVGYNNNAFDNVFLRAWFEQNGDSFMMSWFHGGSLDCMVLATQTLLKKGIVLPSYKLKNVARAFDIVFDDDSAHDATYDVAKTYELYQFC